MKYEVNLIRALRVEERRLEMKRRRIAALTTACFIVLILAFVYSAFEILAMEGTLRDERDKLAKIEAEYRQYKATRMIVDKSDIELLDKLHNGKIFWTKKLAAMASYLPDSYWITEFGYSKKGKKEASFDVSGYGYITPKQEQLVTIDDYLNFLRADNNFNDVFKKTYFNSTARNDEGNRERVSFDYSATGRK